MFLGTCVKKYKTWGVRVMNWLFQASAVGLLYVWKFSAMTANLSNWGYRKWTELRCWEMLFVSHSSEKSLRRNTWVEWVNLAQFLSFPPTVAWSNGSGPVVRQNLWDHGTEEAIQIKANWGNWGRQGKGKREVQLPMTSFLQLGPMPYASCPSSPNKAIKLAIRL